MGKIPTIRYKLRIRVICEGLEEFEYFKRLLKLNVWNEKYDFNPINVNSASNIVLRFRDVYINEKNDAILIFCDTDKYPYREFQKIKDGINQMLGKRKVAEKIIVFANPCTMQIILSHFDEVHLKSQGKKTNAPVIQRCTGVEKYDAHKDQIANICKQIYRRSYEDMKERVNRINRPDSETCSTNFGTFLNRFESDDTKWVQEIHKALFH